MYIILRERASITATFSKQQRPVAMYRQAAFNTSVGFSENDISRVSTPRLQRKVTTVGCFWVAALSSGIFPAASSDVPHSL